MSVVRGKTASNTPAECGVISIAWPSRITSTRSADGWYVRMTIAPASRCGPSTEKGSGWRAPASASNAALAVTTSDYVLAARGCGNHDRSRVREDGIDIRGHQAGKILRRTVKREDFAEARAADGEIPSLAALRAEDRDPPFLEARPPALDRVLDRGVQARARR